MERLLSDEISHANLAQRLFVSLVLKAAILLQLVKTAWERSLNPAHLSDCLFLEVAKVQSVEVGDCWVLFPYLLT